VHDWEWDEYMASRVVHDDIGSASGHLLRFTGFQHDNTPHRRNIVALHIISVGLVLRDIEMTTPHAVWSINYPRPPIYGLKGKAGVAAKKSIQRWCKATTLGISARVPHAVKQQQGYVEVDDDADDVPLRSLAASTSLPSVVDENAEMISMEVRPPRKARHPAEPSMVDEHPEVDEAPMTRSKKVRPSRRDMHATKPSMVNETPKVDESARTRSKKVGPPRGVKRATQPSMEAVPQVRYLHNTHVKRAYTDISSQHRRDAGTEPMM
jgi:hypothetical protein